jgi:hypothetical protein
MAITQAVCNTFKQELLVGTHNFTISTGDVFKIALMTSSSTNDASTTNYSGGSVNISNEVTGTGYAAGGITLTNVTPTISGSTAITDFSPDVTWTSSTITARGAMIYNSSDSNKAVVILNFGSDKSSAAGDFGIVFPTADASNAIIRIV